MAVAQTQLPGGFSDPVLDGQRMFRAIMRAMAEPGLAVDCPADLSPPKPISPLMAAAALALCDNDTPVWLDEPLSSRPEVVAWLGFHTGVPVTRVPSDAHFALVSDPAAMISLENFAQGSQEYPDRSTTLILSMPLLDSGAPLRLEGPGIAGHRIIAPEAMPRHFLSQWSQNGARFPRGVDIILAGQSRVACLPRTVRITEGER